MEQRRHGLYFTVVELVQQQRLDEIFAVMSEGDPGAAKLPGLGVEHTAFDAGTERTGGIIRPQFFEHQFVDRRMHDPIVVSMLPEICLHKAGLKSRESGMDRDRNQRKTDRCPLLKPRKNMQKGPAVLAS